MMTPERNSNAGGNEQVSTELNWLAFRYIAGEMAEAEAASFETRLATEQDAREAVARAVQLAEATRCALEKPQLVISPARQWARQVAWGVCGIAAAVVIALTLAGRLPVNRNETGRPLVDGQLEVRDLAMVWAAGRTELMADVTDPTEETLAGLGTAGEDVEDIETPSWMLTAVAGMTKGPLAIDSDEQGLE